jgi:hypothetical protein
MGSRSAFAGKTDSASKRIADLFSTRLALDRKDVSDDTYTMVVDVVANVLSMPHAVIELPALKETGVDLQRDFLRAAVATGVVVKKGPKHYFRQPVPWCWREQRSQHNQLRSRAPAEHTCQNHAGMRWE